MRNRVFSSDMLFITKDFFGRHDLDETPKTSRIPTWYPKIHLMADTILIPEKINGAFLLGVYTAATMLVLCENVYDAYAAEKLGSVTVEGVADQQRRDAAICGSDHCHNMPQHYFFETNTAFIVSITAIL